MSDDNKARRSVIILLAVTVLGVLVFAGSVAAIVYMTTRSQVESGTFVELHLSGEMTDGPVASPLADLGLGPGPVSLWTVRKALRRAAADDDVAGLLVTVDSPLLGMAQHDEVAYEIEQFAASGKPVHTLLRTDMVGDGNLYAASSGDRVWASPASFWILDGYRADVTFWRGTLDKLHVEPQFIMFKEYKSAGEPFSRYEMSEAFRESLGAVLEDMQDRWIVEMAARRDIDPDVLDGLLDEGMITGPQALDAGLVDELGYRDQVEAALVEAAGVDEYQGLKLGKYLQRSKGSEPEGDLVAVVYGEGQVLAARGGSPFETGPNLYGPQVAEAIRDATEDDQVKAILFRVNSPGGSAVGSDMVWRAIEEAQAAGKPVVVSMSSVAGSGGYWVAMGADAIVAHPSTITGSIGVVFGKFNVRGFVEWIGGHVDTVQTAGSSDMMSPYETLSDEDRARMVDAIEVLYEQFVDKVAEGRGMSPEQVEPIARGRIWSGVDAAEHGLVDELGGMDTALALAAEKAGLAPDAVDLQLYPKPRSFFEMLVEGDFAVQTDEPRVDIDLVEAWLREVSTPRPWAMMPDITVR